VLSVSLLFHLVFALINRQVSLYLNYDVFIISTDMFLVLMVHSICALRFQNSARLQVFTLNHFMPLFYEKIWKWADGSRLARNFPLQIACLKGQTHCKKNSYWNCKVETCEFVFIQVILVLTFQIATPILQSILGTSRGVQTLRFRWEWELVQKSYYRSLTKETFVANAYSARLLTNPLAAYPIAFKKIKLQCFFEKIVLSFQNFSMTL